MIHPSLATLALALAACNTPGPAGPQGDAGEDGRPGYPGMAGPKGETGLTGPQGAPGADGMDGEDGEDGQDGPDGADGADGEDGEDGTDGSPGAEGEDGSSSLIDTRPLPEGDEHCPAGGVEILTGLDDGDGDDFADGELDAAEIDSVQRMCNGKPGIAARGFEPPPGPRGTAVMDVSGGDAWKRGGSGGVVDVEINAGSRGGHVQVFATGKASPSVDFPADPSLWYGPDALVATADEPVTIIGWNALDSEPSAGTYHYHGSGPRLFRAGAGGDDESITGIHVEPDATLTVITNSDYVGLALEGDVRNDGTILVKPEAVGKVSNLELTMPVYYGAPGSRVEARNGGLRLYGYPPYDYEDVGAIFNAGTIDARGTAGVNEGSGGTIDLYAVSSVVNTGNLLANGATLRFDKQGGAGGTIYVGADYGTVQTSGLIEANGGAGGYGGKGGRIEIWRWRNVADTHVSGRLSARGGTALTDKGGYGGVVRAYTPSGDYVHDATVDVRGGDGLTVGGNGGCFGIYRYGWLDDECRYQAYMGDVSELVRYPAGDVHLSGDLLAAGGATFPGASGESGGAGGRVLVRWDLFQVDTDQEITLYGYDRILLDGGSAVYDAGYAGAYYLYQASAFSPYYGELYANGDALDAAWPTPAWPARGPSGGVINYANVSARGGESYSGRGGMGGLAWFATEAVLGALTDAEVCINHGDIDLRGGDAPESAGNGGQAVFWGYDRVENTGDLIARGGETESPWGRAGGGGGTGKWTGNWLHSDVYMLDREDDKVLAKVYTNAFSMKSKRWFHAGIELESVTGPVTNSGHLDVSGGASTYDPTPWLEGDSVEDGDDYGGGASEIRLRGAMVASTGRLSAQGGASSADFGTGGDGGRINLLGLYDRSVATGIFTIAGGDGAWPGILGRAYVDGMNVTGAGAVE